jgi:hypothetical protein
MKPSPEELEQMIHRTLRSLPDRRAPRSLEGRVMAAIAARAALPWWKQSFARWPLAARAGFLLASLAALAVAVFGSAAVDTAALAARTSLRFTWLGVLKDAAVGTVDFAAIVFHAIPPLWLYGSAAALGALYLTLFGLGATAYRTLYASR